MTFTFSLSNDQSPTLIAMRLQTRAMCHNSSKTSSKAPIFCCDRPVGFIIRSSTQTKSESLSKSCPCCCVSPYNIECNQLGIRDAGIHSPPIACVFSRDGVQREGEFLFVSPGQSCMVCATNNHIVTLVCKNCPHDFVIHPNVHSPGAAVMLNRDGITQAQVGC